MLSTYNNYETEPIKIGKYVIIENSCQIFNGVAGVIGAISWGIGG